MSAKRILAGPLALAVLTGLTACTTSGIDIGSEFEAVSLQFEASASAETRGEEQPAALAVEAEAVPTEPATDVPPVVAETATEAAPVVAADSAPVTAAAYAGPTPSSVQAVAAAAGAAAATAPRMRLIHPVANVTPRAVAPRSPELDALIARYAAHYEVPLELVRRVVNKESTFNPTARNRIYWGLMQIRHDTAQTMGYRGTPEGLLDAETNLNYAVRYLRGAWLTGDFDQDRAVRLYQRGYYYDARRKGILHETGLRP